MVFHEFILIVTINMFSLLIMDRWTCVPLCPTSLQLMHHLTLALLLLVLPWSPLVFTMAGSQSQTFLSLLNLVCIPSSSVFVYLTYKVLPRGISALLFQLPIPQILLLLSSQSNTFDYNRQIMH